MDARRWQEIQSTFDTIVEMDDAERAKQLTALSTSDPELRAAVELLLVADSDADVRLAPLDAVFFPASVPAPDLLGLAGRTISHFQVHEPIGAGGMGVVYRAEDTRLGRAVALKFLLPSYLDAAAEGRFLREARLVAALDHPNLCTIYEVGTSDDGRFFLAMALYPGETLKTRLSREGQMGASEALEITKQIAEGLEYAHRAGIVHRDLKPGNVMLLPDGTVKILDFGLAKARDQSLSEAGARFGTVSYMAPEQIRGEAADARADLWALGVVLYEMLAARKPFRGEQDVSIAHAILHDEPVALSTHRRDVSTALEDLVLRLFQKDPARRYATGTELLSELARIDAAGEGTNGSVSMRRGRGGRSADRNANAGDFAPALETTDVPQRQSPRSRRWVPFAIGGGVAAGAVIAAALILARKPAPPPPPDRTQLTITGLAADASLSPDGTRIAFEEKQCDEAGYCTFQLVIQDIDGHNRLVLSRNAGHFFRTAWTSDGRYIVFNALYGPERSGTFAISTLGGEPRFLGGAGFDLLSGDTLALASASPGDSIAWVRRITARDGQTLDSIPVYDPPATGAIDVTRLTYPDRLLVAARKTFDTAPELRLIDFRGAVIDRMTPSFGSLGRNYNVRWVPSRQKLVVTSQRARGGVEYDILSMDVTASRIGPRIDTVFSGLEMIHGVFEVSPDGERLVYHSGPVEGTFWRIDTRRMKEGRFAATQILSSTTRLEGLISPAGDKIVVVRDIPTRGSRVSDFSILPRNGGAESQLVRGVPNLLDFAWSYDGAAINYLHGIEGTKVRLMESDTTGRHTREIARLEQSVATAFHPLPDGAFCVIPQGRRALSMIRRHGKKDVTWRAPDWIYEIWSVSLSPDAKSLAVLATERNKSIVLATVDIENGRFTKLASVGAQWLGQVKWLDGGSIMFDVYETQGGAGLFTTTPGGPTKRLGAFPFGDLLFSVSRDGRHMVASSYSFKTDIFMIRNFGEMLGR